MAELLRGHPGRKIHVKFYGRVTGRGVVDLIGHDGKTSMAEYFRIEKRVCEVSGSDGPVASERHIAVQFLVTETVIHLDTIPTFENGGGELHLLGRVLNDFARRFRADKGSRYGVLLVPQCSFIFMGLSNPSRELLYYHHSPAIENTGQKWNNLRKA